MVDKLVLPNPYSQLGMTLPAPQVPWLAIAESLRLVLPATLQTAYVDFAPKEDKVNRDATGDGDGVYV